MIISLAREVNMNMKTMNEATMMTTNAGARYWGLYEEYCNACGRGYYTTFCYGFSSWKRALNKGSSKWKAHMKDCVLHGKGGCRIKWDW